ncbi:hypothetical protein [Paenibacillus sp. J31TS4]|nr:hypothetical protein [Paenibacillus sp. J31TS4]
MKPNWLLVLALALVFSMTPAVVTVQAQMGDKKETVCLSPKMVQLKVC